MVTAAQLKKWVINNERDAQTGIVELIWRLVIVSCPNFRYRRFFWGGNDIN